MNEKVKRVLESFYDDNPFVRHLDIRILTAQRGKVTLGMPVDPNFHANAYGVAHGGAMMSLCDTAMGASCLSTGRKVVTVEMNMNCIKAAWGGANLVAAAEILHEGARTLVAECKIADADGALCAVGRATFYVIGDLTETNES